jgi:hypothetical protein
MLFKVRVQRHLVGTKAPAPPSLAIPRLIDGNPVDPRPQGGLAAEPADGAEDLEKDVLREVAGIFVVSQQVERQLKDHALMIGDQFGTRLILASHAAAYQPRFSVGKSGPVQGGRLFHRKLLSHVDFSLNYNNSSYSLDTRMGEKFLLLLG